jgi:hypothetical protein
MKRLLILFVVLSLAACSPASRKALVRAEQLWESRPDSALAVLDRIPEGSLRTPFLRARYARLLTSAQYKSRTLGASDSLIGPAYEYYRHFGTRNNRMMTAYLRAIVKQNAGENIEAAYLFYEAESLARYLGKKHYLGLIYEHLCSLYSNNYDPQSAYECAQRAVQAFDEAGETLSADFSRLDLAGLLYQLEEKDRAARIVDSLLAAPAVADPGLRFSLLSQKANYSFWAGEYAEAESYYKQAKAYGFPLDMSSRGCEAVLYERLGNSAGADSTLNRMLEEIALPVDSAIFYISKSSVDELRGDMESAYLHRSEAVAIQNRAVSAMLDRSITHSQRSYFEDRYASERAQKWTIILLSTLVGLCLLIFILFTLVLLRKRKMRIIEEMEKVEGISQDLRLLQDKQKGAGAILTSLVQDKIRGMQQLTDTYFSWTDEALYFREQKHGKPTKEDVVSEFRTALRSLRNDDHFIPSIEKTLDISSQDLIARLRATFSGASEHKMKEMDFNLLTLLFAGFTPKSISFIMDMTEESVRTRKCRYKKLFVSMGEAGSDFAERLL